MVAADEDESMDDEDDNAALQGFIDGLWAKYDEANNGKLDKEKSLQLCKELNV